MAAHVQTDPAGRRDAPTGQSGTRQAQPMTAFEMIDTALAPRCRV
jgi:hypothetical protein